MIAAIACLFALSDQLAIGQKWSYVLTWHFYSNDIDMTDEESFDVEVSKVLPDSTTLKISQKLTASIVDKQRIPTDPKALPATKEWALSPTGSVAFMPNGRYGLESKFYRILKGILPAPKGDLVRDSDWVVNYEDDGFGVPKANLSTRLDKKLKDTDEFVTFYREKLGTNGIGRFIRSKKMPFPSYLEMKFLNTKMSGGTDVVSCDLTMKLKVDK